MLFSHRKGLKPVSKVIQTEGLSPQLRNSLWNVLDLTIWQRENFMECRYRPPDIDQYSTVLWLNYFKIPVDTRPDFVGNTLKHIRKHFFECEWNEVYDFLEFTLNYFDDDDLIEATNTILDRELSGYRFVGGVFTDITGAQEIAMLDEALRDDDFPAVSAHLQRALELLSDRENPDFRNSIKESISAVESLAREITGDPSATLGQALKTLEKGRKLHPALAEAFTRLYGYTSDEGGIRHAMLEVPDLSVSDARFFLLSCTSFIGYLKSSLPPEPKP